MHLMISSNCWTWAIETLYKGGKAYVDSQIRGRRGGSKKEHPTETVQTVALEIVHRSEICGFFPDMKGGAWKTTKRRDPVLRLKIDCIKQYAYAGSN